MKTALKLAGVAAGALLLLAFKKKRDYAQVIEKMTWNIHDVRNFRIHSGDGVFDMDVAFHNNTPFEFDFDTAGYIQLHRVNVLYKGQPFGTAISNTTKFSLPPYGNFLVTGIQVRVSLMNLASQVLTTGLDSNLANYSLQLEVRALGQTFMIDKSLI